MHVNISIIIIIILSISLPHIHHTTAAAEYSPSIFCHISIKYEEPRTSLSNYLVKCTYYELLCTSTVVVSNTKEGDTYQRWTRRSVINSDGFYKMNSSKFSLDGFFNHQHTKAVSCECFFCTVHTTHTSLHPFRLSLSPSLPLLSFLISQSFFLIPTSSLII